jgi:excinuclease ABC subunit B
VLQEGNKNFDVTETVRELEEEMITAANNLEFEKAALLRDQVRELKRATGEAPAAGEKSRSISYGRTRRGGKRQVKTGVPG